MTRPDQRAVARAIHVLAQLPPEAIGAVVERLIDRLDMAEPDPDLEEGDPAEVDDEDCCGAGDDDPVSSYPHHGVTGFHGAGDPADAEEGGDLEPDAPRPSPGAFGAAVTGFFQCCPVRVGAR